MKQTIAPNINHLWMQLAVEELVRNGVNYFCIAPGSRSTPITTQIALNKKAHSFVHFDERGLAFHALGYVAATSKPCAIVTTSGSACANLLPAIIEASKKKLPLIVITADRPPELRSTGANQTIDQVKIFGEYARAFIDLPTPTVEIPAAYVLTTIDMLINKALGELKGPVHLNCMFREPLAPTPSNADLSSYLLNIKKWLNDPEPYTRYERPQLSFTKEQGKDAAQILSSAQEGIIVVGKLATNKDRQSVLSLNERLNWPIFADATSGLRLGRKEKNVITHFDQLLLSDTLRENLKADCILHLGGRMTSKRYYDLIERLKPAHYIAVLNHPLRNDPLHQVSLRVQAPVHVFCDAIKPLVAVKEPTSTLAQLNDANKAVEALIEKFFDKQTQFGEFAATRIITQKIPEDNVLFVANSLPIREVDMFGAHATHNVTINANRGASGIDGLIASACGYSIGADKPVTLLIGDLAFLYDLNSLAMIKELKRPMTIVVLNNNGGGIFSFLPVAQVKEIFEPYFGTPHGLNFEQAAKLFGLEYAQPKSAADFQRVYGQSANGKKSTIIEIKSDRNQNPILLEKLSKEINLIMRWRSEPNEKKIPQGKKSERRTGVEALRPIRRHQVS